MDLYTTYSQDRIILSTIKWIFATLHLQMPIEISFFYF